MNHTIVYFSTKKNPKVRVLATFLDNGSMPDMPEHPLYVATRRLVKALDQLEGNLKYAVGSGNGKLDQDEQVMVFERENGELKQERENLNGAIATLQRQYNDLHKIASNIYGKLDDSIKNLTYLIEE